MKRFYTAALLLSLAFQSQAQLLINEVCYDPSNVGLEGDANGDGTYDQTQDEFIEFVNAGQTALDISKYKIYDHDLATGLKTLRHTVAQGIIIPAGGAMVVFGGGSAVGSFGGSYVAVDVGSAGLSLNNSGESIIITDSSGTFVDSIDTDALSDNPNESYTRNPDFDGDFVQHHFAAAGVLFSPGIRVEGGFFTPYVSIASELKSVDFQIFPNPGKGIFHLSHDLSTPSEIQVSDLSGRTVFAGTMEDNSVDLSLLKAGVYVVRMNHHTRPAHRRLVITE